MTVKLPFPWFGGKSKAAHLVWAAMGDVKNYVEPFFGSGAVFFNRPHPHKIATLNDIDGFIVNFWRSLKHAPAEVAKWAAWPVSELDITAMHVYIVQHKDDLAARLEADIDYHDARIAGYWVYGLCSWIGSGWALGNGSWVVGEDGKLVKREKSKDGINRKLPHIGNAGMGINRQLPHLSQPRGINRQLPHLSQPQGINRHELFSDALNLMTDGEFTDEKEKALIKYFQFFAKMLSVARITAGDWKRIMGKSVTYKLGLTGIFLDPPYSAQDRTKDLYTEDDLDVAKEVREWCLENGDNQKLRIVLAGYEGEGHEELLQNGWRVIKWKARGGYANVRKNGENKNKYRERLYISPHCLQNEYEDGNGII